MISIINKSYLIFLFTIAFFTNELNGQDGMKEKKATFANSINSPSKQFNSNESNSNITGLFIGRIIGSYSFYLFKILNLFNNKMYD